MSIHHNNPNRRMDNISKIKYHLPGQYVRQRAHNMPKQARSYIESRAPTRKGSTIQEEESGPVWKGAKEGHKVKYTCQDDSDGNLELKSFTKNDISFQVLGISEVTPQPLQKQQSKPVPVPSSDGNKIFSMFPEGKQKQQFLKFVDGLKHDQNYQNTVTMFTIMYYYQKKTGHKMNTFL